MNIEQARKILADENASTESALEEVAAWARFHGIANPRLLPIAESLEEVAQSLGESHGEAEQ